MSGFWDPIVLKKILLQARDEGVALTTASYLDDAEVHSIVPSIRLTCSVLLEKQDIVLAGEKMRILTRKFFQDLDWQ